MGSRVLPALSMAEAQLSEQQQQQPHSGISLHVPNAAAPALACVFAAAQAPQEGTQAAACLVSAADLAT